MDLQLSQNVNLFFGHTVPALVFIASLANRVLTIGNYGCMVNYYIRIKWRIPTR